MRPRHFPPQMARDATLQSETGEKSFDVDKERRGSRLTELEVDLGSVLEEKDEYDYDSAHSPYPEGMARRYNLVKPLMLRLRSESRCTRDGR